MSIRNNRNLLIVASVVVLLVLFYQNLEDYQEQRSYTQATSRYCFRAITALSVQGAWVEECRLPFKHMQHIRTWMFVIRATHDPTEGGGRTKSGTRVEEQLPSNGSAVKLPKGVAKKRLYCAKMS